MTVLEQGSGRYRVRLDSADENLTLNVTVEPESPDSAALTFKSGKELYSDRPFAFSVKALYKGVQSETVHFAFDYIPDYFGEDPEAPTEEPEPSADDASAMAAFIEKRRYLGNFDDVSESDWFFENVKKTYELGILNGCSDDEFGTEGTVTAAQAITIAARLHSIYYTGKLDFATSEAGWFAPYLEYALENGLVDEAPADPNAELDREGFVRTLDGVFPEQELAPIADIPADSIPDVSGDDYYVNYIYTLYRAGILRGAGSLRFEGDSPVTRAQAAAIITRFVCPELRAS
ncbi:MAG: S-layer homology domain-containing protein [Oscillospiraceae bacterium]|nr:S-layer homology domain-containing protein [Oscillospiraceae bacterium]